jgi:hypothetical protein
MIDEFLKFPGLGWFSDVLSAVIVISFEIAFFVLALACLKYNVPGTTRISRIAGMFGGILLGLFFAKGYTVTFAHYWTLCDGFVSATLILFILMNMAIVMAVYKSSYTGGSNVP